MTRLYELTGEYAALQDAAEAGENVDAALAKIEASIEAKAGGIVRVLANLEADAEAAGKEAARLFAKRKAREAAVERLREYVRNNMIAAGINRIKGPTFTISLSPAKSKVLVHSLDELRKAAPELVRTVPAEYVADKVGVLERYERDGECLPGTEVVPSTALRIT